MRKSHNSIFEDISLQSLNIITGSIQCMLFMKKVNNGGRRYPPGFIFNFAVRKNIMNLKYLNSV